MRVHFTRKRLLVGFRGEDWSDVWFEPVGEVNEEGETELGLFTQATGAAERREPMPGDVHWFPHFNPDLCESKNKKEREQKHKQFLTDAWLYCNEALPEKFEHMEQVDLDRPGFSRWQSWFRHAKKWKSAKMKEKASRLARRRRKALASGATEAEVDAQINADTSDDSAYKSEEERQQQDMGRRMSTPAMPPPPTPPATGRRNNKRGSTNGAGQSGKQTKIGRYGSRNGTYERSSSGLFITCGLGSRSTASGSVNGDAYDADEDDDSQSQFDPRPPESLRNHVIYGQDMDDIRTSNGNRVRGNSRDVTPFHEWAQQSGENVENRDDFIQDQEQLIEQSNDRRTDTRRMDEMNGEGVDEDEAIRRATRDSMSVQPPERGGNGEDGGMGQDE